MQLSFNHIFTEYIINTTHSRSSDSTFVILIHCYHAHSPLFHPAARFLLSWCTATMPLSPYIHWHPIRIITGHFFKLSETPSFLQRRDSFLHRGTAFCSSVQMMYCRHVYGSDRLKEYTRNTSVLHRESYLEFFKLTKSVSVCDSETFKNAQNSNI